MYNIINKEMFITRRKHMKDTTEKAKGRKDKTKLVSSSKEGWSIVVTISEFSKRSKLNGKEN